MQIARLSDVRLWEPLPLLASTAGPGALPAKPCQGLLGRFHNNITTTSPPCGNAARGAMLLRPRFSKAARPIRSLHGLARTRGHTRQRGVGAPFSGPSCCCCDVVVGAPPLAYWCRIAARAQRPCASPASATGQARWRGSAARTGTGPRNAYGRTRQTPVADRLAAC